MRLGVVGMGAVGMRAARALSNTDGVDRLVLRGARRSFLASLGPAAAPWGDGEDPGVVLLAGPAGAHPSLAREHVEAGRSVVSVADDPRDVDGLLALDAAARDRGVTVVVGAAFSPGLSCVLARHAGALFDEVEGVDVAMLGAGGPDCTQQRRRLLAGDGRERDHHHWVEVQGGTGDELVWFPDPIGPRDCARGAFAEPTLLARLFPSARRLTARGGLDPVARWWPRVGVGPVAAEGEPGAIRVEVEGRRSSGPASVVYAVMDRPAVAAAVVAAAVAVEVARGVPAGARGVGETVDPVPFLADLARRGVRAATFEHH